MVNPDHRADGRGLKMSEQEQDFEKGQIKDIVPFDGRPLALSGEMVTALQRFRTSGEVRVLGERVQFLSRGSGDELNMPEAIAVAAYALTYGLDPMQQIHHWHDGDELVIYRGRDGTEDLAHRAAKQMGTSLSSPQYYMVDQETKRLLDIPEDALALEARIKDDREVNAYVNRMVKYKGIGFEPERILEIMGGPEPYYSGIGVMYPDEIERYNKPRWFHYCTENKAANTYTTSKGKKRRVLYGFDPCPDCNRDSWAEPPKWTPAERTRKRANTAALQKWAARYNAFDQVAGAPHSLDKYAIAGEWKELADPEERQQRAKKAASDLGWDYEPPEPPPPPSEEAPAPKGNGSPSSSKKAKPSERPWKAELIRSRFEISIEKYKGVRKDVMRGEMELWQYVRWQLGECFAGDPSANEYVHSVIAYLTNGRETSSKGLTGAECMAIDGWLDPTEDEIGDLRPVAMARLEARMIVNARMEELGQEQIQWNKV